MFHAPRLLHLGPLHGRPLVDLRAHARHVVLALPAAGLDVPHRRLLSVSPLLTLYTLTHTKLYNIQSTKKESLFSFCFLFKLHMFLHAPSSPLSAPQWCEPRAA